MKYFFTLFILIVGFAAMGGQNPVQQNPLTTNTMTGGVTGQVPVLTTNGSGTSVAWGNAINYILTNQVAAGPVYSFAGVETNATINGTAFPLNGGPANSTSSFSGNVSSNSVYLVAGVVLGPFSAQFGYYANAAFTGTNVQAIVYTNGVGSGETLTFTVNGIQTNLNTLTLVAPSTVCIVWTNSPSTFAMGGCVLQWSLAGQVPTSTAGVTVTNTFSPTLLTGYFTNIVITNPVPDTNFLFASGAGTNQANGKYQFAQTAFTGGWIYSNVLGSGTLSGGGGYICKDLGGNLTGNQDQHPFYMGTTTNNLCTSGTVTNNVWYFSSVSETAYWTNADNNFTAIGKLPDPVVTYGTNLVNVTTPVFICQTYFGSEYTNGNIYVSQAGNDALATSLQCAFATCKAAKAFATVGKTINVEPGWYEDHDLLKNGVNWHFEKGAVLAWDEGQFSTSTPRGIFDDYAGAVTSTITCDRFHYTAIQPDVTSAIITTNAATLVYIEFNNDVDAAYYTVGNGTQSYPGYPSTPTTPVLVQNGYLSADQNGTLILKFNGLVSCGTNGTRNVVDPDNNNGGSTYGTIVTILPNSMGFDWALGEEHIIGHNFIETNNGTAFGSAPSSQVPIFLWADNSGSVEQNLFVTADYVAGHLYDDSQNAAARCWYNITYMNGDANALRLYGNDLVYYSGQKLANSSLISDGVRNVIDLLSGSGKLWLNVEKVTQNGKGCWINFNDSKTEFIDVQYFEDTSGANMVDGFEFGSQTDTNFFFGGFASISNKVVVSYGAASAKAGPPTYIQGMTMQSVGNNADLSMVFTNGLTLLGCDLISTFSIGPITSALPSFIQGNFTSGQSPTNTVHMLGTNWVHNVSNL